MGSYLQFYSMAIKCFSSFKINLFKKSLSGTLSNSLYPDQDQHSVSPDLGSNYLQMLLADDKSCHYHEKLKMARLDFII